MQVQIDASRCQGHGRCYELAPAIFSEDDEGYGTVTAPGAAVPADQYDAVRLADANCPEAAVLLVDDPT